MKKSLIVLIALICVQTAAFADDTANIKIRINGAIHDNRYFLCLPNVGCLSILAAEKGKVYPVFHPIQMSGIFVTDVSSGYQLSPQGLPSSCDVTVDTNKTITISGSITTTKNNGVRVNQLHCSVS
jgi:hypothetical protein